MNILRDIVRLVSAAILAAAPTLVLAQTPNNVVTNTGDTDTIGTGSLRAAINYVNSISCVGANTIDFQLAGAGPHSIKPATPLPVLSCGMTINGYSQSGSSTNGGTSNNTANIQIILDGQNCVTTPPATCDGLVSTGSGATIKGLAIRSFTGAGIRLTGGYAYIQGNFIGTDPGGSTDYGNGDWGVRVDAGTGYIGVQSDPVASNLITGNALGGVFVGVGGGCALSSPSEPSLRPKGLKILGAYAEVKSNQIGGTSGGLNSVSNSGPGVYFSDPGGCGASLSMVENYIRYNSGAGVVLQSGQRLQLLANYIYGNGLTAFDLSGDGHGANGNSANGAVQTPEITGVDYTSCSPQPCVTITAKATDASRVDHQVRFDFFHNDASPTVPEGKFYMGSSFTSVGSSGVATTSVTISGFAGQNITATATYGSCAISCGPTVTSEYSFPKTAGPTAAASFAAGSAPAGTELAYNVVVSNPNAFVAITGLSVAVTTPANLKVASAATQGDCATGGSAPVLGANSASVSGASIPAGGTCTFRVMVYANTVESFTMGPGNVTISSDAGGAAVLSPSSFSGTLSPPTLQLSIASSVQAGVATPLKIDVSRTAGQASFNGMTVTLTLPGGATITTAPTYGCPPGTGSPATGVSVVSASSGAWSGTGSCSFVFTNVKFPAGGTYTVTINAGDFTWKQGSSSTVFSNASPTQSSVAVFTPPAVLLSPPSLAFGGQLVGSTSAPQTVTVTNTGGSDLVISSISGPAVFPFTGCSTPLATPLTLAAGASCTLAVKFSPTATTGYSGQLAITSNASGSPHTVNLTGSGTAPGVGLSPSPLSFGSVTVGTSSTSNITLNNPGTAPLQVSAIAVSGSVAFTVGSACVGTLAVQATCQIPVTFTPTDTNPQAATLSVQSNASGSPHTVALSGTGIAPGVSLTPSPVTFGNVPVGGSASSPLTLTNTGTAPLLISGIATTGAYFSNTTDCGSSLAAGTSCQILVTYAPLAAGPHSGQVSVITNAGAGPVVAPLSGTGAVPVLALTGTGLTFGSQTVGTASVAQTITINNTGGAPLNISAITATGDFNFTGCATPLSIAPGAGCTLSIKFVPTAVGARTGGISIASNAAGSPHAITLSGDGTPVPVPGIALAPSSADFGALVTGMSSTQVLVLSNPGTAPLAISSIGVTGVGFSQANTCPSSLSPSLTCNISVTFAPTVTGPASGQLAIVSNAAPSPLNAALTGSGLPATTAGITFSASSVAFPPQFVGTTSAPKTVTLTSSGTAPLVISQVTGSGDFAFSGCGPSTLAPNATCTFTITFRPQSVGALTGSIVVTSNASGSPHTIALSGDGGSLVAAAISLSPSAFGFDTLRVGRTATIVGRLTNTGAATLVISQIQSTGSFFSQSNNCPATLAVGGFCDVTVAYSPTAAGAHSGQLLVHSNVIPSPFVAAMSGTAVVVPPPFLSTNGPVSFGQQVTGTTVRRTLVLTNTGGEALNISALAIVGSGAFGVEGGCGTIAPEASCSLTITFLPTGINTFNARLDIASNHSGGVVQVQLSGQGVALPVGDLDFSVAAVGFGNQTLGTAAPGAGQTVRLTNIGGAPVTISALRSTLPDFTVNASQCIGTLQPRAFCDLAVVFRPFRPGPLLGSLLVDSSPVQNDSVSLIGVGCRIWKPGQSIATLCSP